MFSAFGWPGCCWTWSCIWAWWRRRARKILAYEAIEINRQDKMIMRPNHCTIWNTNMRHRVATPVMIRRVWQWHMCALKLQFVCISAPTTGREVCPRSWLPLSTKTLKIIHTLKWRLPPMRIDKVSTAHEKPTSKEWQREAGLPDQPTDQLLPDNDTRVWMADEWKISCEVQRRSVNSQEMLSGKRKCWLLTEVRSIVAIRPPKKRSIQDLLMFSSAFHPPWTLSPPSVCKSCNFFLLGYLQFVNRIREMVSFELGKEIERDVLRLVKSVGHRKNSESPRGIQPQTVSIPPPVILDQFMSSPFCSLVNGCFLFPAIYL